MGTLAELPTSTLAGVDRSLGSIGEFLPFIGYDDERELDRNFQREEHGLPRLNSRMAETSDAFESQNSFLARDAFRVSGTVEINRLKEK